MKKTARLIALLISIVMLVSMFPADVFAANGAAGGLSDIDFTKEADAGKYEISGKSQSSVVEGTGLALISTQGGIEPAKQNIAEADNDVVRIGVSGDWSATLEVVFDTNGASNGYYQFFAFFASEGGDNQNMVGIRGGDGAMQDFIRKAGAITEETKSSSPGFNTAGKTYWLRLVKEGTTYLCSRSDDGDNFTDMFSFEDTEIDADEILIDAYTGMTANYKFTLKYLELQGDGGAGLDKKAIRSAIREAKAKDSRFFTADTFAALTSALAAAETALAEAETQEALDAAAAALNAAIAGLEDNPELPMMRVTFNYNYTGAPDPVVVEVKMGSTVEPIEAKRIGYSGTWRRGNQNFNFNTPIEEDITLTANWTKDWNQMYSLAEEYRDYFPFGNFGTQSPSGDQVTREYNTFSGNSGKMTYNFGANESRNAYNNAVSQINARTDISDAEKAELIKEADGKVSLGSNNPLAGDLNRIQQWNQQHPEGPKKYYRQHVLCWHGSEQNAAFYHEGFDTSKPLASREVMNARIDSYVEAMFKRYQQWDDIILSWDVVNEALDDYNGMVRNGWNGSGWGETSNDDASNQSSAWGTIYRMYKDADGNVVEVQLGSNGRPVAGTTATAVTELSDERLLYESEWIRQAFASAKKWKEELGVHWTLYYNDYMNSSMLYEPKVSNTLRMLKPISDAGNLEGYGMQARLATAYPSTELLRWQIEEGLKLAPEVSFSEADVRTDFEVNPQYDPNKETRRVRQGDEEYSQGGSGSYNQRSQQNGNTYDVSNGPVRRKNSFNANDPQTMREQADYWADLVDIMLEKAEQGKVGAIAIDGTSDGNTFNRGTGCQIWDSSTNEKPAFFALIGAPNRLKMRHAIEDGPARSEKSKYTAASWNRYEAALKAAEDLVDVRIYDANGVEAVKAATVELLAATEALVEDSEPVDPANMGLKDYFKDYFRIGTAVSVGEVNSEAGREFMIKHFNSVTCENDMKPQNTINQAACQAAGDNVTVAVQLNNNARTILKFCEDNGIPMRGHVFCWHSQTPAWLFNENFDSNGATVSKEIMDQRLESYIKNYFELLARDYPNLTFYSFDVVNEAFTDNNPAGMRGSNQSGWIRVYGDETFIYKAFEIAHKYKPEGCLLAYNDYNEYNDGKVDAIYNLAKDLYQKGWLDAVGMQGHLELPSNPTIERFRNALARFASIGCRVMVTELDVQNNNNDQQLSDYYQQLFETLIDYKDSIEAVVFWGNHDGVSWRSNRTPLLFRSGYEPKPAYYAVLDAISDHEHVFESKTVQPTCTQDGYVADVCTICDRTIVRETIPALGHDWDDGKVTKEPTETEPGIRTFTCKRCGETKTKRIPRIGATLPDDIDFTNPGDADKFEIVGKDTAEIVEGQGVSLITTTSGVEPAKQNITETPVDVIEIPVDGDWTATLEVDFDTNGARNGYYQFFGFYGATDYNNMVGIRGGDGAMQDFIRKEGAITEETRSSSPGFANNGTYYLRLEKAGDTYTCYRSSNGEDFTEMFSYADTGIEAEKIVIDAYTGMTTGYKFTLKSLTFEEGGEPQGPNKTALNKAIADAEKIDTSKYTDETVAALNAALADAKAAQSSTDQAVIDAAAAALNAAIAALEKKPVEPGPGDDGLKLGPNVIKDPDSPTGYTVKFLYKNDTASAINFNGDISLRNDADRSDTRTYDPTEYRPGLMRGAGYSDKPMEKRSFVIDGEEMEVWYYEVPLACGANQYWFTTPGSSTMIADPANTPIWSPTAQQRNGYNYVYVPYDEKQDYAVLKAREVENPRADKKGTWSYVPIEIGGTTHHAGVYLPYGYQPKGAKAAGDPYKTIWILHGGGQDESDWMNIGSVQNIMDNLAAEGRTEPAVIVSPTTNNNMLGSERDAYANLFNVVLPFIEEHYNVSRNKMDRAFGGLSMGSMNTQNIINANTTAEKFGYYGPWSGGVSVQANAPGIEYAHILFAGGSNDFGWSASAGQSVENLINQGVYADYMTVTGAHDFNTWCQMFRIWCEDYLWKPAAFGDGGETDTAALEAKIAEAEAIDTEPYTDRTVANLVAAIEAAKGVVADPLNQRQIDKALSDLENAIARLKEKPSGPVTPTVGSSIDFTNPADAGKYEISGQTDSELAEGEGLALIATQGGVEPAKQSIAEADIDVVKVPVSGDWTATLEVEFDANGAANGYYQFFGFYASQGGDNQNMVGIRGGDGAMQDFIRKDGAITEETQSSAPGFDTTGKTYFLRIEKEGDSYTCYRSDDGEDFAEMFAYTETGIDPDEIIIDAYTGMTANYKFILKSLTIEGEGTAEGGYVLADKVEVGKTYVIVADGQYAMTNRQEGPALRTYAGSATTTLASAPVTIEGDRIVSEVTDDMLWTIEASTAPAAIDGLEQYFIKDAEGNYFRRGSGSSGQGAQFLVEPGLYSTIRYNAWSFYPYEDETAFAMYANSERSYGTDYPFYAYGNETSFDSPGRAQRDEADPFAFTRNDDCSHIQLFEKVGAAPECDHDYVPVVTAPTCTEKGYTTYTCSKCGKSYKGDETAALGHAFGEWVTTTAATCTAAGVQTRSCSRCDAKETKAIAATGHSYGEWTVTKAATCTEAGVETRTCANCDAKETRAIAATGHTFGEWAVTKAATCTAAGEETRTCSKCGEKETKAIEALGHNFVDGVCTRCGEKDPTYVPPIDKAALQAAIAAAEKLDLSKYTDETADAVSKALAAAKAALEADTQAALDAAKDALNTAVDALVEKPVVEPFRFDDVKDKNQYYFNPVYWAYEHEPQITNGTSKNLFSPEKGCTRAQVVTFLWRYAGMPEPNATTCNFKDVDKEQYYYKAVLWAVEKKITNGTSETTFDPEKTCTRAQIVTFLWRYAGEPKPATTKNDFKDVKDSAYYYNAVLWAAENDITNGTSATTFDPEKTCTRAQIVTFLYRYDEKKGK